MVKNIFFDFDGVLVESMSIKTEAFKKMYLPYGEDIAAKAVKHHMANGGMSRYEKFYLYHKDYLGIELSEEMIHEKALQYSELVMNGVIDAPEVKGSHEFLHNYHSKFKLFVITGTPTTESIEICKKRGIYDCFIEVMGSPKKKTYWCENAIKKYGLNRAETIFVGDATADYHAAKTSNLDFYLREYNDNKNIFKNVGGIFRFKDFVEFKSLILSKN